MNQLEAEEYTNIIVGGFSMGGSLILHLLLKYLPHSVKGIFSIGSFLIKSSSVLNAELGRASRLPLLMMHGTAFVHIISHVLILKFNDFRRHIRPVDSVPLGRGDGLGAASAGSGGGLQGV